MYFETKTQEFLYYLFFYYTDKSDNLKEKALELYNSLSESEKRSVIENVDESLLTEIGLEIERGKKAKGNKNE